MSAASEASDSRAFANFGLTQICGRGRSKLRWLATTFAAFVCGQLILGGLFLGSVPGLSVMGLILLSVYGAVALNLWVVSRFGWQHHPTAVSFLAGAASVGWVGLVHQYAAFTTSDVAAFVAILGGLWSALAASTAVAFALRNETDEISSIRFSLAAAAGIFAIAVIQAIFFPVTELDGGREFAALGPLSVLGATSAALLRRGARLCWLIWPAAAFLAGAVYTLVAAV